MSDPKKKNSQAGLGWPAGYRLLAAPEKITSQKKTDGG